MATRPTTANGLGLTPLEARQEIHLLLATYPLLPNPTDLFNRWLRLCSDYGVSGRPSHDARLVALMEGHGIKTILTLNPGDFKRYGLRVISPDAT